MSYRYPAPPVLAGDVEAEETSPDNAARLSRREQRDFLMILDLVRRQMGRFWSSGGVLSTQDALLVMNGFLQSRMPLAGGPVDMRTVGALTTELRSMYSARLKELEYHLAAYKDIYEEITGRDLALHPTPPRGKK